MVPLQPQKDKGQGLQRTQQMLSLPRKPGSCTSWRSPLLLHQHSTCNRQLAGEQGPCCWRGWVSPSRRQNSHSLLEELVEAKFSGSLNGVAKQSRAPASDQAIHAVLLDCDAEAGADGLELFVVNLHIAFHNIHGSDHGMCQATAQNSTDRAGLVKLG